MMQALSLVVVTAGGLYSSLNHFFSPCPSPTQPNQPTKPSIGIERERPAVDAGVGQNHPKANRAHSQGLMMRICVKALSLPYRSYGHVMWRCVRART